MKDTRAISQLSHPYPPLEAVQTPKLLRLITAITRAKPSPAGIPLRLLRAKLLTLRQINKRQVQKVRRSDYKVAIQTGDKNVVVSLESMPANTM